MCYSCKRGGPLSTSGPEGRSIIQKSDVPAPTSTVTLIGTVHHDPRSAQFLARLLEELKPDQLTVEIAPSVVAYRQTHGLLLLRRLTMILERLVGLMTMPLSLLSAHPSIVTIRNLLALPYEFHEACVYAQRRGLEVHAIDQGGDSLRKLRHFEESLVSLSHLKRLAASPAGSPPNPVERYELARQLLTSVDIGLRRDFLQGCRGEEGVGPRDRHLAGQIRLLSNKHPGHLVHIGGWVHLLDDPGGETLYTLLSDLHPQRILLHPEQPVVL